MDIMIHCNNHFHIREGLWLLIEQSVLGAECSPQLFFDNACRNDEGGHSGGTKKRKWCQKKKWHNAKQCTASRVVEEILTPESPEITHHRPLTSKYSQAHVHILFQIHTFVISECISCSWPFYLSFIYTFTHHKLWLKLLTSDSLLSLTYTSFPDWLKNSLLSNYRSCWVSEHCSSQDWDNCTFCFLFHPDLFQVVFLSVHFYLSIIIKSEHAYRNDCFELL